jgi:Protein of unknown function (DUF2865)
MHSHRIKPWVWHAAMIASALAAAALATVPVSAHAAGLLDFLFGGGQQQQGPPPNLNSYAEPPPPLPGVGRVAPASPTGAESVRQGGGDTGRAVAYCVRLCDGLHFPLEHMTNATPVETCRAMCPASKTKIFFGSEIGGSVARDGQHYADLDTAFIYRKQLVANCTCNGKDAFGLAPYDMSKDPTLRPGDIVSTKDGFVAYSGKSGPGGTFTPVDSSSVAAALNPRSARVQLSRRAEPPQPASDDEDPGTITPSPNAPPVAGLPDQSVR